jgi:hypothetical protein
MATVGLAFCVAIVTFAGTFLAHLKRDVADQARYGWNWDVKIGSPALPDIADPIVPALRDLPNVTDLSVGGSTQLDVGGRRVDVLAIDSIVGNAQPTILEGRVPRDRREIVLGSNTMREIGTGVGRIVAVRIGNASGAYRVVGKAVFPDFGDSGQLGTGASMTVDGLRRLQPAAPRNNFYIGLRDSPDHDEEVNKLMAVLSPLPARLDAQPDDLVNLSRGDDLILLLGVALGALAFAMLAHAGITTTRAARASHATLRALGFSRFQSARTVVVQMLVLGSGGIALGIPVGVIAGRLIWGEFAERLGVTPDLLIPFAIVALILGGTVLVTLASAIAPAQRIWRAQVATVLRAGD